MKRFAALALVFIVLGATACKCPPGASVNLANVEAIVEENDAARAKSDAPASLKATAAIRNREALDLAKRIAENCK